MKDIERESFEKGFPVPVGVYWSADLEQYEARQMDFEPDADEYHRMWQVWQAARAQAEQPSAGVVPEGLRDKVNALCDAIINDDELPPTKYALRCGRLINEVRDLLTAAPTAPAVGVEGPVVTALNAARKSLSTYGRHPIIEGYIDRALATLEQHPHNGEQGEWVNPDLDKPLSGDERGDVWGMDIEGNVYLVKAEDLREGALPHIDLWQTTGLKRPAPPTEREVE